MLPAGAGTESQIPAEDGRYLLFSCKIVRIFAILALAFWGLRMPFGAKLTRATFDILVTLAAAQDIILGAEKKARDAKGKQSS